MSCGFGKCRSVEVWYVANQSYFEKLQVGEVNRPETEVHVETPHKGNRSGYLPNFDASFPSTLCTLLFVSTGDNELNKSLQKIRCLISQFTVCQKSLLICLEKRHIDIF